MVQVTGGVGGGLGINPAFAGSPNNTAVRAASPKKHQYYSVSTLAITNVATAFMKHQSASIVCIPQTMRGGLSGFIQHISIVCLEIIVCDIQYTFINKHQHSIVFNYYIVSANNKCVD